MSLRMRLYDAKERVASKNLKYHRDSFVCRGR